MVGFIEKPTGRLGNVMIQYAFLRQIAKHIGVDYFHIKMPYADNFIGWESHNISWEIWIKRKWVVDQDFINREGIKQFIIDAKMKCEQGYIVVLKPPILGYLFEFKNENPGIYFTINNAFCKKIQNDEGKIIVGVHFRGGDFKKWNKLASLDFEYYHTAIEYMIELYGLEQMRILLFTDDVKFESYQKTLEYIKYRKCDYVEENSDNHMMTDFCQLTQCDAIISSPSTYAIMASVMGKNNKMIFHNKKWVDYCISRNEQFWIDIACGNVPYYKSCILL